ncbi:hypothetical protein DFH09DRAFT_1308895 [Mycena vulgaris]|nr:hypothetical protein DFH09DRAFT_1308895 [Mycena vulgaris]
MPALRRDAVDFEEITTQTGRVKCLPCSTAIRTVDISVTSISAHRKTAKHIAAVKETNALIDAPPPSAAPVPAAMTLAGRFNHDSEDSDEEMLPPQPSHEENPFQGTMTYGSEIFDPAGNQVLFSAGEIPVDNSTDNVWGEMRNLEYFDHTTFADMSPMMAELFDKTDDCTVSEAVRAMAEMGLDDLDEEDEADTATGEFDREWAPHGSKPMFMLDLLDNLPRLRLSDDHVKAIIWVMKECGTPGVPSFYALRKMQKILTEDIGLKPRPHTSALNNQFFMNHPNDLIRLDFANPLVRQHLHFYPEITTTISESWQAAKYVEELDLEELSPMWANWNGASHRHFYVKELAQCRDGSYFIPLKWIVYKHEVHADGYSVAREESGIFTIEEHKVMRVLATDLRYNFLDLDQQGEISFSGVQNAFKPYTPHPVRTIAGGKPVFVLRIMPWADDVSGNRSKQYNAHMNMYLANINLPHKLLAQEYFIRFCSTSPHASSLEQFDALAEDCKQTEWTGAYDSETTSTAGSSATYWCREGDSGGSAAHRESDDGYHALYSCGRTRKPEETVDKIKEQIKTACLGVASAVDQLQTDSGVKDKIAVHWIDLLIEKARLLQKERVYNRETRDPRLNDNKIKGDAREIIKQAVIDEIQEELYTWVILQPTDRYEQLDEASRKTRELRPGDHFNVLLRVRGLDPHRDSPCEILHTILLGEDKYVWHDTSKVWNDEQGALFAARLQCSSIDGLNLPALRSQYMVQYKKSLVGKHYKALQQLSVFQFDDNLCPPALFELWKANGILGALLWYPEIKNMEQYLRDLTTAIDNVLDRWAVVDPVRITVKYKLHVLPHIPEAVRRFGPSTLFATEIFECWNTVFRLCSVLSNHQAPSLDIATTLADMERFKHQVSGGWWKPLVGDWTRAGSNIRSFLVSNKQLQRRLGWTPPNSLKPGTVKFLSQAKRCPEPWTSALGSCWSEQLVEPLNPSVNWIGCKYAVAQSEDPCFPGSWVFFSRGDEVLAGRIIMILVPDGTLSSAEATIILEAFIVADTLDDRYDMPLLMKAGKVLLIKPENLLFKFNAQHDCRFFSCPLVDSTGPQQERLKSKLMQKIVHHSDDSRFLLNTHALHNAHLVRETLPPHLTELTAYFADRYAKHKEFAEDLRVVGPEKRAQAVAKGQATKAKNRQDKADQQAGAQKRGD